MYKFILLDYEFSENRVFVFLVFIIERGLWLVLNVYRINEWGRGIIRVGEIV